MTTMSATEFARNISRVLDAMERGDDTVVILRNNHAVATLLPGAAQVRALDAFKDLFGIIPDKEGAAWIRDMQPFDRFAAAETRDPWA